MSGFLLLTWLAQRSIVLHSVEDSALMTLTLIYVVKDNLLILPLTQTVLLVSNLQTKNY